MIKHCKTFINNIWDNLAPALLSLTCFVIGINHFHMSGWKADWILFAFVALCFAPWLGSVFESIGGEKWGAKYRRNEQGKTFVPTTESTSVAEPVPFQAAPAAPAEPKPAAVAQHLEFSPNQFLYQEMKVLATLWRYQKLHFHGSRQQLWTFTVGQGSPEYMSFSLGFINLVRRGFADLAPNNGQVMLTQTGFDFCQAHDEQISIWDDIYDKFSN